MLAYVEFNYVGQGGCRASDGSYPYWYYGFAYTLEGCQEKCGLNLNVCLAFDFNDNSRCSIYVHESSSEISDMTLAWQWNWSPDKTLTTSSGVANQACYVVSSN